MSDMITFNECVRPENAEEAYKALISKKSARLIGGGCFLRMGSKRIGLAVDLSNAGLDYINDTGKEIEIGAMTTLGTLERSDVLREYFGEMIRDSVKHIIGVQLRNIATIGATVYSKYGFSDPITALLALNADVHLYEGGRISLEEFLNEETRRRDLLEKIIIKKNVQAGAFETIRNSSVDYAILSVAACKLDSGIRIAVGARPRTAALSLKAMEYIDREGITEETSAKAGEIAAEELHYGSNCRGSGRYRQEISKVLVKRALLGVSK